MYRQKHEVVRYGCEKAEHHLNTSQKPCVRNRASRCRNCSFETVKIHSTEVKTGKWTVAGIWTTERGQTKTWGRWLRMRKGRTPSKSEPETALALSFPYASPSGKAEGSADMYMILWCIYYTYINWYQSISSCIIYHDLHAYKFIAPFLGATWYRPGWCQLLRGCKHAGSLQNPHEHQHWSIHGLISNRSQPTTGRSRFDIFNQHRPQIGLMFSHPNFLVVDAFWRFGTLDL